MSDERRWMRADLHVHSYHSGYASHLRFLRTRDCYSDPEAVYLTARARGMDLVTLTDHDSIDGCLEFLSRHPDADDFFISEEIECRLPGVPLRIHIAAYDIDERIHAEAHRLRPNVHDVVDFLRRQGTCFALNHFFFFFDGQIRLGDYIDALWPLCPAVEVRNGTMLRSHNELVEQLLRDQPHTATRPITAVGGSDAHTLRGVATTYTEAEGQTRREFLESLKQGRTRVCGRHGGTLRVASEIYGVIWQYWRSLLGVGRQDFSWPRRTLGLLWSAASLPVEFLPLLIAALEKAGEARRVADYRRDWEATIGRRAERLVNQDSAVDRGRLTPGLDRP
jgi:predicted metal-dependent phosphoesterase TrpH